MAISVRTLLKKLELTPLDISKLDETRGLYFKDALLTNAKKADLSGCVFYRCCLVGVGFDQSNSVFIDCTKRKTMFALSLKEVCEFGKTALDSFEKLNLSGANLEGANLQGANLQGANLQDTNLRGANLLGANLDRALLYFTILKDANLQSASLHYVDTYRANLEGANLQGAYLYEANLRDANLRGANLQSTSVMFAHLYNANLHNALYDENTRGLTEERKAVMTKMS